MLTVSLTVSGCTISLILLGKFVTNGFSVVAGTGKPSVIFSAQPGSFTSRLADDTAIRRRRNFSRKSACPTASA